VTARGERWKHAAAAAPRQQQRSRQQQLQQSRQQWRRPGTGAGRSRSGSGSALPGRPAAAPPLGGTAGPPTHPGPAGPPAGTRRAVGVGEGGGGSGRRRLGGEVGGWVAGEGAVVRLQGQRQQQPAPCGRGAPPAAARPGAPGRQLPGSCPCPPGPPAATVRSLRARACGACFLGGLCDERQNMQPGCCRSRCHAAGHPAPPPPHHHSPRHLASTLPRHAMPLPRLAPRHAPPPPGPTPCPCPAWPHAPHQPCRRRSPTPRAPAR
jgi:hypothetical protein